MTAIRRYLEDHFVAGCRRTAIVHPRQDAGAVDGRRPYRRPAIVRGPVVAEGDESVDIAHGQRVLREMALFVDLGAPALLALRRTPRFVAAATALIHFQQAVEARIGPVEIGQRSCAESMRHDYRFLTWLREYIRLHPLPQVRRRIVGGLNAVVAVDHPQRRAALEEQDIAVPTRTVHAVLVT